jgi:hypothetical protein
LKEGISPAADVLGEGVDRENNSPFPSVRHVVRPVGWSGNPTFSEAAENASGFLVVRSPEKIIPL